MTTPTPPPTRRHATRAVAATLGLGALTALGLAAPAAANEFPPNPAATIEVTCDPAPGFSYTLTNVGGLDTADFSIEATTDAGTTTSTQQVAVDESTTLHAPVPEDTTGTLTIVSEGMQPVTLTEQVDCFDSPTATIVPTCGTLGAAVAFTLEDPDDQVTEWVITIDGEAKAFDDDVFFQYGSLAEGDAWEGVVTADGVEVASLAGVVDCVQPAAEIELECTADGPNLLVHLHRDDATETRYEITWPEVSRGGGVGPGGSGPSIETVDPGTGSETHVWELPREVEYGISVSSAPEGVLADLAGSSGCGLPQVESSDPVVPPAEVTPVEVPVTPVEVPTVAAWSATPRATELARTGSETPWLVAGGTTLLGLGLVVVRIGRRMLAA